MRITKALTIFFVLFLIVSFSGCRSDVLRNGSYFEVNNKGSYITVKGETITLNQPSFGDDSNEMYHFIIYLERVQNAEAKGIILTDEEKEELKKDLPDFNPSDYIGKTYRFEIMNKETYVKGENYDIMLWDNDKPVEILSGEYNPSTRILTIGGSEYSLKK